MKSVLASLLLIIGLVSGLVFPANTQALGGDANYAVVFEQFGYISGKCPSGGNVCPWYNRIIYISDTSGPAWPVNAVAADYEARIGGDIDIRYGACVSPYPCIRVVDGAYGNTGNAAKTDIWINKTDKLQSAEIMLNNSYGRYLSASALRQVTCKSIGHALGLMYNRTTLDSCMYGPQFNLDASDYPAAIDISWLKQVY